LLKFFFKESQLFKNAFNFFSKLRRNFFRKIIIDETGLGSGLTDYLQKELSENLVEPFMRAAN